jgi:hypothetical protein
MERRVCLEYVLSTLRSCNGVLAARLLTDDERLHILRVEKQAEGKLFLEMCPTVNRGVREALAREFAVGLVIDSEEFAYPHHPHMKLLCGDTIVGEQVKEPKRKAELRKDRATIFLWDNFALYRQRLPRNPEDRNRLRLVYEARSVAQLHDHACVTESVFGTPSTEGDGAIKTLLAITQQEPIIGTCIVGFNLFEERVETNPRR